MKKENFEYTDYISSIHRYGRIGLSIALLMLLAAPFVFSLITGVISPRPLMGPPLKMNHKALCLLMLRPEGKSLPKAVRRAKRMRRPVTMPLS